MSHELDFSGKRALIVGGSSGIGNGIARAFYERGAEVHVWGTRASAADYAGEETSDLRGLGDSQIDVTDAEAVARSPAPFDTLDILVICQGGVMYRRQEFEVETLPRRMAIHPVSLMSCTMRMG